MPETASNSHASAPSILSTLNDDGSRRWIKARPSPGRFFSARRMVAYGLILIFTAIPYIKVNGKPWVLLDLPHRRFTILGHTFLPTDTLLLALFVVGIFLSIFLLTALLGRVWCGWGCPQTVYMEFVFRPIERLFEGTPGRSKKGTFVGSPLAKGLKFATYFVISCFLAHTFLAYFVGVDTLATWVTRSPLDHPTSFLIMAAVTALMMFDFTYFREQTCIVACPYGRFQSVMLDRRSLIVAYDSDRGEPRGRSRSVALPVVAASERSGDCVDCGLCVSTCPTGIDIRNGLQMECIHCAQCIDACDGVMAKLKRPLGLIRYSSQDALAKETSGKLRPRLFVYPGLLLIVATAFLFILLTKGPLDMTIVRGRGAPFVVLDGGLIANPAQIKLVSRDDAVHSYFLGVRGTTDAEIRIDENPVTLGAGESRTIAAMIVVKPGAFSHGRSEITITASSPQTPEAELDRAIFRLVGPASPQPPGDTP